MYSDLKLTATYQGHRVISSKCDNPSVGDYMIKNNKLYVYTTKNKWSEWSEIGCTNTALNDTVYYTTTGIEDRPHRLKRKTCSACGAPMHGYICEYCGSEYY